MKREVLERLDRLAEEWALPPGSPARLGAVLEELAAERSSVTTVREPGEAVGRHVADSLTGLAVAAVPEAATIADLGSGGGFPGLVLAIALPEARVFLVESVRRKCNFLERVIAAAEIGNTEVVCDRAESWEAGVGTIDVVTARALAPLPVIVEYAAPLLRTGGTLVAWKGSPSDAELAAGSAAAQIVGLAPGPSVGAERTGVPGVLVTYTKAEPTPDRFPRRAGMARKRPLA